MAIHYDGRMGPFRMRDDGSMEDEDYEESYEEEPMDMPAGMSEGTSKKNKGDKIDRKSKPGHKKYKYDANIPKARRTTQLKEESGLTLTYPDLKKATLKKKDAGYDKDYPYKEVCVGLDIDNKRQRKKCIKRIQAVYRKEHAVLYTAECNAIRNPFKRKKCIAKYNRGL